MNQSVLLCLLGVFLCGLLSLCKLKIFRLLSLIGIAGFLIMAVNLASTPVEEPAALPKDANLEVDFLDVGQGLAVLIRVEDHYMLYDGGGPETAPFVVSYLKEMGVNRLDYVVASHYDADHISGLLETLYELDAEHILGPDYETASYVHELLIKEARQQNKEIEHPSPGTVYPLGTAQFEVLSPTSTVYDEENNHSLAIRITNGKNTILLMGDAEAESEYEMIESSLSLSSDVICVGHHGSSSSTTADFLHKVKPKYAVISCSSGNAFGHPHRGLMNRLKKAGVHLFRTDKQGTVKVFSNGTDIFWSTEPCDDFTPGRFPQAESFQPSLHTF